MRKLFYSMLAAVLPMMAISMASCNNENDLPDVTITLDVTQGTVVGDTIYVAQGDTIDIAKVVVTNKEEGKDAAIANVTYYWDGYYYAPAVFAPYKMIFPTSENTPVGKHSIDLTCNVLAVDKSLASAIVTFPVKVVASKEDIPMTRSAGRISADSQLKN